MTHYLVTSGTLPFTGAELCAELGIDPAQYALTLEEMITVEACNSAKPVLASVWRITDDARFEEAKLHGGIEPIKISEPFEYLGATYRDCTYVAHPHTVAMLRARVLTKARTSDDVNLWRAIKNAEERQLVEAHVALKDKLVGSLELEGAV